MELLFRHRPCLPYRPNANQNYHPYQRLLLMQVVLLLERKGVCISPLFSSTSSHHSLDLTVATSCLSVEMSGSPQVANFLVGFAGVCYFLHVILHIRSNMEYVSGVASVVVFGAQFAQPGKSPVTRMHDSYSVVLPLPYSQFLLMTAGNLLPSVLRTSVCAVIFPPPADIIQSFGEQ